MVRGSTSTVGGEDETAFIHWFYLSHDRNADLSECTHVHFRGVFGAGERKLDIFQYAYLRKIYIFFFPPQSHISSAGWTALCIREKGIEQESGA